MSSLPSGSQAPNGNNSSDDNGDRQRSIVFAWIIALGLVLLIVLFLSPGWLVPHIEATQDNTTTQVEEINDTPQVEEIDAGAEETDDIFSDEVQAPSNETISVNDNTDDGTSEPVAIVPVIQIDTTPDNVNEEVASTNDEEKTTTTTGGGGGGGGGDSHSSNGGSGDGPAGDDDNPVDDDENTGEEDNGGQNGSEIDEGCTVQYWQNHQESWTESLSPNTLFSSELAFNITITGMEDLTLMDALGLEGDLVNQLLSEGSAGLLNAAHHDIHYFKSQETVTSNVVDGLDPQVVQSKEHADDNDIENRISRLVTENYRGCPLLVNE